MVEVTQKGFEVAEIRFLKPSWLIKYDGKDPIVSRRDHVFQILVHTVTIFHVDDDSTNLFFKSGGHGKSNAAFIPTTSSSFRYCAVKKHADADSGSDNSADENANNANGNNDAINPNAAPSVEIEQGECSGVKGGDDGGDDGNKDGGNADNKDGRVEQHPIRVHRIDVNFIGTRTYRPIINTNLIASQCNSWQAFAGAIYSIWVATDGAGHDNAAAMTKLSRYNCWPGGVTSFGRYENGKFIQYNWGRDEWEDVKTLITDVRVTRYRGGQDEDEDVNNANNASRQGDDAQDQTSVAPQREREANRRVPCSRILDEIAYICYLASIVIFVAAIALFFEALVLQVIEYFHRK